MKYINFYYFNLINNLIFFYLFDNLIIIMMKNGDYIESIFFHV